MRRSSLMFSVSLAVLLCSCKTTPNVIDAQEVQPPARIPPAEALVECDRSVGLDDDSFGAVVRALSRALGLLEECASKQKELREYIGREG